MTTERKGMTATTGCLLALVVSMLGGGLVVVLAAVVLLMMGPTWMMQAATEPAPLANAHEASPEPARDLRARFAEELKGEAHTTRLTGPELTTILRDQAGEKAQVGVTIADGTATLDFSVNLAEPGAPDAWLTVHAAGTFTMERGWLTAARVDACDVSGWEFASLLDGKQLVDGVNQELANQRAKDPAAGAKLDALERVTFEGDALVMTVTADGSAFVSGPR